MKKALSILLSLCFIFIATSCDSKENISSQTAENEDISSSITSEEIISSQESNNESASSQTPSKNSTSSKEEIKVSTSSNTASGANTTSEKANNAETDNTTSNTVIEDKTSTSSKNRTPSTSSKPTSNGPTSSNPTSSIQPTENWDICEIRGNDLPHKWVSATCETPQMCSYCKKVRYHGSSKIVYEDAFGHTLKGDGKCTVCSKNIDELVTVECPNTVTFEGYQYEFDYYSYNTKTREILFKFTYSVENPEYDGLYLNAKFYKNDTLLSSKTIGKHPTMELGRFQASCYTIFEPNTTKIVLDSIG